MTPKEKAAIIEEAKKHEPDIWSDEYFPYWEKVYAQFEESEEKEMKEYKVKHYHTKVLGLTFEEVPAKEDYTEYTISASTAKEAAVIAHGLYNGYSLKEMAPDPAAPYRTIREQLEDTVKASPVGENTEEKSVFLYDNIAGHVITVEEEDKTMKRIELNKLTLEVKDIPDNTDITRFCVDRIDDCSVETIASFDDKDEAYEALSEYTTDVDRIGNMKIVTSYVLEFFEADEDGEFVEGSDYDWLDNYYYLNTEYLYGDYSVPKCAIVRGRYDRYGNKDRDTEKVMDWTEYEDIDITVLSGEDFDVNDTDDKINNWIREKLYFLPDYEVN